MAEIPILEGLMPEEKDRWFEMFVSKYEKEIQIIQDEIATIK